MFVDQRAARDIHQHRAIRQQRQCRGINHPVGCGPAGRVDRQKVAKRQHVVEIRVVCGAPFQFGRQAGPSMIQHLHIEPPRALRKRSADPPHAQDADPLAGHPHPQQLALADAVAPALPHDAVVFQSAASGGEQQHHGVVGGALVQHAGRVGDGDAARPGRRDVDMVEADATGGADPDAGRQPGDGRGGQRQRVGEQDRLSFQRRGGGGDLGHGHVARPLMDHRVELRPRSGDHRVRGQAGQH